jgi:hypothetical protein
VHIIDSVSFCSAFLAWPRPLTRDTFEERASLERESGWVWLLSFLQGWKAIRAAAEMEKALSVVQYSRATSLLLTLGRNTSRWDTICWRTREIVRLQAVCERLAFNSRCCTGLVQLVALGDRVALQMLLSASMTRVASGRETRVVEGVSW